MSLKDVFKRGAVMLNPKPVMKQIGDVAKVEFNGNRVFVGLRIPSGGLEPDVAKSKERRAMFSKMVENLHLLGLKDIEYDESMANEDFPTDSVFVPIDTKTHKNNRKIIQEMLPYTDYMKHSHNRFPTDWQR